VVFDVEIPGRLGVPDQDQRSTSPGVHPLSVERPPSGVTGDARQPPQREFQRGRSPVGPGNSSLRPLSSSCAPHADSRSGIWGRASGARTRASGSDLAANGAKVGSTSERFRRHLVSGLLANSFRLPRAFTDST
jgi:hypothetical protein